MKVRDKKSKVNSEINLELHTQKSTVDIKPRNVIVKPPLFDGQVTNLVDYYSFDRPTYNFSLVAPGLKHMQKRLEQIIAINI